MRWIAVLLLVVAGMATFSGCEEEPPKDLGEVIFELPTDLPVQPDPLDELDHPSPPASPPAKAR